VRRAAASFMGAPESGVESRMRGKIVIRNGLILDKRLSEKQAERRVLRERRENWSAKSRLG